MTIKDTFELRKQGRPEEAYEAARQIYAVDKGPEATAAMFWTAVDILHRRIADGQREDASKILRALQRLLQNMSNHDELVRNEYEKCVQLLNNNDSDGNKGAEYSVAGHTLTGIWGEELAAEYLRNSGYIILERNWHSGHRDIDIVAQQNDTIIFVEVKTRRSTEFATPEQAVDWRKRRNLRHAVNHYVKYRRINAPIRFDIISIVGTPKSLYPDITHIVDVNIFG